jgi:hypothetical protein
MVIIDSIIESFGCCNHWNKQLADTTNSRWSTTGCVWNTCECWCMLDSSKWRHVSELFLFSFPSLFIFTSRSISFIYSVKFDSICRHHDSSVAYNPPTGVYFTSLTCGHAICGNRQISWHVLLVGFTIDISNDRPRCNRSCLLLFISTTVS